MKSTPPAAMSQTSFPFQIGPIAPVASSRSGSLRGRTRCSAPTPRSKPSRTTYIVIMNARKLNHMVSTRPP
jgi:hypothetical protein